MNGKATPSPHKTMVRFRTNGGILDSATLRALADTLEELNLGEIHLTTRASLEFHLSGPDAADEIRRRMLLAGLDGWGATGPVVRGAAVSTPLLANAGQASMLSAKILDHFRDREEFSSLPRKFKVGVDAGYESSRHLIQDAGFVMTGLDASGEPLFDLWLAGGLGRDPVPAFHFRKDVPFSAAIPLLQAVVRVFRDHGEPRKRLKYLVRDKGREWFCDRIADGFTLPGSPPSTGAEKTPLPSAMRPHVIVPLFAGQAGPAVLRAIADVSELHSGGMANLTPGQDIALITDSPGKLPALVNAVRLTGLEGAVSGEHFAFSVCPGRGNCSRALCHTREIALSLEKLLKASGAKSAALSGCPNSCAQPQLADIGIICVKMKKKEDGSAAGYFRILKNTGKEFSETVFEEVPEEELAEKISGLY